MTFFDIPDVETALLGWVTGVGIEGVLLWHRNLFSDGVLKEEASGFEGRLADVLWGESGEKAVSPHVCQTQLAAPLDRSRDAMPAVLDVSSDHVFSDIVRVQFRAVDQKHDLRRSALLKPQGLKETASFWRSYLRLRSR